MSILQKKVTRQYVLCDIYLLFDNFAIKTTILKEPSPIWRIGSV